MGARRFPTGVWEFDTVEEAVEFERVFSAQASNEDCIAADIDWDQKKRNRDDFWGNSVVVRGELILLCLNRFGKATLAEIARRLGGHVSRESYLYPMKKLNLPVGRDGDLYFACRVSKLWNKDDEVEFGRPKFTSVQESEPSKQTAMSDKIAIGLHGLSHSLAVAVEQAEAGAT